MGLRQALFEVLAGALRGRCRVPSYGPLGLVPRGAEELVGAWARTIFAQPDQGAAREQLELVAGNLERKYAKAAELLREAAEDGLAPMAFLQGQLVGAVLGNRGPSGWPAPLLEPGVDGRLARELPPTRPKSPPPEVPKEAAAV